MLIGTGAAVVAAAAGYAAFAAYAPKTDQADTPTVTVPPPTVAGGGTQAPSANALANVSDIPENGGVVLAARKIVLTRTTGDQVKAFTAVCTHLQCLVNKVSDGTIQCPCHGSAFDAATGAVVNGPAASPLAEVSISVVNGVVEEK